MKHLQLLPLLAIGLFISNRAFSQSELAGEIIDENSDPVSFANVILLNAKDSVSVVKGVISEDDGSFPILVQSF